MNKYAELKDKVKNFAVLLVEDDIAVTKELKIFLSKFFSSVGTAENGAQGVEKFRQNKYRIVFADVIMPVMDGWEMVDRINKINPDTFIVMLSASKSFGDASKHKYDAFLKKPVGFQDMISIIKEIVKKFSL